MEAASSSKGSTSSAPAAKRSSLAWRAALQCVLQSLKDAARQELLVARFELTQALSMVNERLQDQGVPPEVANEASDEAAMDDAVLHELAQDGWRPALASRAAAFGTGVSEETSMAATVAQEMQQKRRRLLKKTSPDSALKSEARKASDSGDDEDSHAREDGDAMSSQALEEDGRSSGEESLQAVEVIADKSSGSGQKADSIEDRGDEPSHELHENESQDLEADDAGLDDVEDATVFLSTPRLNALRAKLANGGVPTSEELEQLFDVEALPEGHALSVLDTSLLGGAWPPAAGASPQVAARTFAAERGASAALELILSSVVEEAEQGDEEEELDNDEDVAEPE